MSRFELCILFAKILHMLGSSFKVYRFWKISTEKYLNLRFQKFISWIKDYFWQFVPFHLPGHFLVKHPSFNSWHIYLSLSNITGMMKMIKNRIFWIHNIKKQQVNEHGWLYCCNWWKWFEFPNVWLFVLLCFHCDEKYQTSLIWGVKIYSSLSRSCYH